MLNYILGQLKGHYFPKVMAHISKICFPKKEFLDASEGRSLILNVIVYFRRVWSMLKLLRTSGWPQSGKLYFIWTDSSRLRVCLFVYFMVSCNKFTLSSVGMGFANQMKLQPHHEKLQPADILCLYDIAVIKVDIYTVSLIILYIKM